MENLIITYCILLFLIIFTMLGLLLWNKREEAAPSVSVKDNLLLACATIMGFIILQMNLLLIPFIRESKGDIATVAIIAILVLLCLVPAIYLIKNLIPVKEKKNASEWKIYVAGK
ncbi:hypothetical protein ACMA1I_21330 [Pontibacter sp. 13R65]|uniref:hypothetical protein n=1 Tax=Pontibacter sp. 13R65 TaxID=3127458 RepID=UPI00301C4711